MVTIHFIPGNIVSPNAITLPATAPDIESVVSAEIIRVPNGVAAHGGSGTNVVHGNGANPVTHANAAVAAHTFTQPGTHTLTPDVAIGGGVTMDLGENGAGVLETEGAAAVAMENCIDAHAGGGPDTHAVAGITDPDNHLQAAIVAAVANHTQAQVAASLADHVGADPVVAGGPYDVTMLSTRTFSLNVDTEEGDLLSIDYLEVGERVLVS